MSKVFSARFHGDCVVCFDQIVPGDDVCYNEDDDVIHAHCREPVDLDAPARPHGLHSVGDITRRPKTTRDDVCPICSLIHAGECP